MPLSVAAGVAYFRLADASAQLEESPNLSRALTLAAIALSQVATIEIVIDGAARPMSPRELRERLFGPAQRDELLNLDGFLIRRADLHAAINTLSQARSWFR